MRPNSRSPAGTANCQIGFHSPRLQVLHHLTISHFRQLAGHCSRIVTHVSILGDNRARQRKGRRWIRVAGYRLTYTDAVESEPSTGPR